MSWVSRFHLYVDKSIFYYSELSVTIDFIIHNVPQRRTKLEVWCLFEEHFYEERGRDSGVGA